VFWVVSDGDVAITGRIRFHLPELLEDVDPRVDPIEEAFDRKGRAICDLGIHGAAVPMELGHLTVLDLGAEEASLILPDAEQDALDEDRVDRDAGRYAIHELLRQYAEAELRQNQELWDPTVEHHASYFAQLTSGAEALVPLSDQKRAFRMIEDDLDNIRWAWRHALATPNAPAVRQLVVGLYLLHEIRGWYQAAVGLFGEALGALDAGAADEATQIARSAAAAVQAHFVGNLGRPDKGVALASEAAEKLAALPDRHAHLIALETQCELLSFGNNQEAVLAVSWEAIRVAEAHGLGWWAAGMRNYRLRSRSNWGTSRPPPSLEEGEVVLSRLGDHFIRTWNLELQAMIATMQGRLPDAVELHRRAIELARDLGYPRAIDRVTRSRRGARCRRGTRRRRSGVPGEPRPVRADGARA